MTTLPRSEDLEWSVPDSQLKATPAVRPPLWQALRWVPATLCCVFSLPTLLMGLMVLGSVAVGLGSGDRGDPRTVAMLIWHGEIGLGLTIGAGVGLWAAQSWIARRWALAAVLTVVGYFAIALFFNAFSPR